MNTKSFFGVCLVLIAVGLAFIAFPTSAAPARQAGVPDTPHAPDSLEQVWKTGLWGTGIGASGITALDLDEDPQTEIVLGGGYYSGENRFWYVLSYDASSGSYRQEWLSREYSGKTISRLAVADPEDSGEYRIYVALSDATVEVYDASDRQLLDTFNAPYAILSMCFADVDEDGEQEIITGGVGGLAVMDAVSYAVEWQSSAYPGESVAVGNLDGDPTLEIVTPGAVLDGVTHAVEWDYPSTFGARLRLADLDADGMAEIIAVLSDYEINAYDADTQTLKWTIPSVMDVQALYVGDVDGDTVQEVVAGDGQWGAIHAYDSQTLLEEWSISNPEHGVTDLTFADADDDGSTEVLWGAGWTSSGPDYLYAADLSSHAIEWQSADLGGPLTALDSGDVDNDGRQEIVLVSYNSQSGDSSGIIFVYDAETYALEWQSEPLLGDNATPGAQALKLGDVDADGVLEIVVATALSEEGVILAYDGLTHALDWQTALFSEAVFTALAVADVDIDGDLEVLGGMDGVIYGATGICVRIFDGLSGVEEWHTADLGSEAAVYDIAVGEADGDGHSEILFSDDGNYVYVYDGVTQLQEWQSASSNAKGVFIADVDQDGQAELLLGTENGSLEAYNGLTHALEWSLPVSSSAIAAMRIADFDLDSLPELTVCDNTSLYVYDALSHDLLWHSDVLGTSACKHGHLAVGEIDELYGMEAVLGSYYALYVFTFNALPFEASLEVSQALVVPGTPLTYTLQIENLGTDELPALVTSTLPLSTTFLPGSLWASLGTYELVGDEIQWSLELPGEATASLHYGVSVDAGVPDGTLITGTADFAAAGFLVQDSTDTLIDALPPQTSITQPGPDELISGSSYIIAGSAFDAVSGVELVEVNLGGSGWQAAAGTENWQYLWTLPLTDSWYTLQARSTDGLGQVEEPGPSLSVYVDNLSPYIVSTSPADGESEVLLEAPLVVTFSEAVLPETLQFSCEDDPGGWSVSVSPDGRTFTLSHDAFDALEYYRCTIEQARDAAGHNLIPGSVPNPWDFTTINTDVPVSSVTITAPTEGEMGVAYWFSALSLPAYATTPMTYIWETAGRPPITHTAGISDRAVFAWTTPGTKVVTLTVYNSVGSASDTHTIVITGPYETFIPFITKEVDSLTGGTGGRRHELLAFPASAKAFSCVDVSEIPKIECEALVAFYQSTQGEYWNTKTNWLVTNTPSDWYGITVASGHVTEISLEYNNTHGPLPAEFVNLSHLQSINLIGDALTGIIPVELGSLSSLQHLALGNNMFTGTIPAELGNLSNLQYLDLSWNWYLTDTIPTELSNLINLQSLYLNHNQLTGSIPAELANLSSLELLSLWENQLTGAIPPELGMLSNLQELGLYSNQLTGTIPPELGMLSNLQELYLFNNQLTGSIPSELGNLSNLRNLVLMNNQLSGPIPAELGNLLSLEALMLHDNQLDGSIPAELGNLGNLRSLQLYNNQLTGSIPAELGNLSSLFGIDLSNNPLTGPIPPEFGNLSSLNNLTITNTQLLGPLPAELGNLSKLTWLDLTHNQIGGGIPFELGNLSALIYLDLSENDLMGGIPPELGHLSHLQELYLNDNALIGVIPAKLSELYSLDRLYLHNNQLVGAIPFEMGNMAGLEILSAYNNQLSGSIPPAMGNLWNLRHLSLANNQLTGSIPAELGNLSILSTLYLDHNQLTGPLPDSLGNLSQLVLLEIQDNPLSGSIPMTFIKLAYLERFYFFDTKLCIPTDQSLRLWMSLVDDWIGTGDDCFYCYLPAIAR